MDGAGFVGAGGGKTLLFLVMRDRGGLGVFLVLGCTLYLRALGPWYERLREHKVLLRYGGHRNGYNLGNTTISEEYRILQVGRAY